MNNRLYYQLAGQASQDIGNHQGLQFLESIAASSKEILDVGCGEGSRLNLIAGEKSAFGVDINKFAINQARSQYSKHQFVIYDGKTLPYNSNKFDLVYSAFVLEHTTDPENFLNEMVRVTKPNGTLVILCPNFGSPNRRSPNSTEKPLEKLIHGFFGDLNLLFTISDRLVWTQVTPKEKFENIDDDTTIEPYSLSLRKFLENKRIKIIKSSSLWNLETFSFSPRKLIISSLGKLNIYPFRYWGPQIFIAGRKLV